MLAMTDKQPPVFDTPLVDSHCHLDLPGFGDELDDIVVESYWPAASAPAVAVDRY